MKLWKRKAEDDSKDWTRYIAQQHRHKGRNFPIFACADDEVEITAELVTLSGDISLSSVDESGGLEELTE
jgi:hypothetical protein